MRKRMKMRKHAARVVADIMMGADGGCSTCGENLLQDLRKVFPEHSDVFASVWSEKWPRYSPITWTANR